MPAADAEPSEGLPDDLADLAAERLLAVELAHRGPVLAQLQTEHPRHADELAALAAALAGADRLLGGPATALPADAPEIPGYAVIRHIGAGAFGSVYLCAQERPVVRQVAVKILRAGLGDAHTVRRFEAERQVLATLNHPAITQVFDAGTLADGRPYFVMEYVDGVPFRRFCDDRLGTVRERLVLFVELCRGVAHAHRRGIVHRDLKPANVLVVESDAGPMPKIIDFGIAKAMVPATGADGPHTDAGRVIGTPGYMSPEQAAGRSHEIDQRADVFALGVMLYELLTGALPWSAGASATDTEPIRPSARAATTNGTRSQRSTSAELRGDLDWITLRALGRDRNDRYASAIELAADVERHLAGVPVSVGPPALGYRLRKFVRRNRTAVVLAAIATALAVGLGDALYAGGHAAAAGQAEAERVVATLVARANDPRIQDAPRGDTTRRVLLEDALSFYDRYLVDRPRDPQLRAGRCRSLLAIAQVHRLLGDPAHAGPVADDALAEARGLCENEPATSERHQLLADALLERGRVFEAASEHAAAEPLFREGAAQYAADTSTAPKQRAHARAVALREAAATHDVHDRKGRIAGLRSVLLELDPIAVKGADTTIDRDRVETGIALGNELIAARDPAAADAVLRDAEGLLEHRYGWQDLRCQVAKARGRAAWNRNDRDLAIAQMRVAVTAAASWQQREPDRLQPQQAAADTLRDLGVFLNYTDDFDGSDRALGDALARGDAMVAGFPGNPTCLTAQCRALRDYAYLLRDRFRLQDLDAAAAAAAHALELAERIPSAVDVGAPPRWQLLALCAEIEDSLRPGGGGELWPRVEAALPTDATARTKQWQRHLIQAELGLANWHFARGERDDCARCLGWAQQGIREDHPDSDKLLVDTGWLEARLAAAAGDHVGAAAAAERIHAARPTWFGCQRAGDALHLAWHCAQGDTAVATATVDDYRKRATAYCQDVLDTLRDDITAHPDDPFYVLPWGIAALRLAEFAESGGDVARARDLLAQALPRLQAVETHCQADQWDAAAVADGRQRAARLADGHDRR